MSGIPVLVLVRHGQTDFNFERRFQGQSHTTLNANGRDQARRAGEILANLIGSKPVVREYLASDLARARETAEIVAGVLQTRGMTVETKLCEQLREIHVGEFQNHTFAEYERAFPEKAKAYLAAYDCDPDGTRAPGGESRRDVAERIEPLWRAVEADVRDVSTQAFQNPLAHARFHIWVSHGAVIAILLERMGIFPKNTYSAVGNGDVIVVAPQPGSSGELVWRKLRHYQIGDAVAARVGGGA